MFLLHVCFHHHTFGSLQDPRLQAHYLCKYIYVHYIKKNIWSVQVYMVKTTKVQETPPVTMIWQYVDSLYVNRVCVLRAGDELLPSRSHSHLPLQPNNMWLCRKDPESLHTFLTQSVHNDTWKYVLSERKIIVTNIGEDNKHTYARLEEGKGEHKHCVFLLF
jgi:hypothetical protein